MPAWSDADGVSLQVCALRAALDRLSILGLIQGDRGAASALLTRLIAEPFGCGERDQENLILYAIGRFQVRTPPDNNAP